MTPRREWFANYEPYIVQVKLADGHQAQSASRGTILIRALVEGEWSDLRLVNVLHVPSFDRNLFSTRYGKRLQNDRCREIDQVREERTRRTSGNFTGFHGFSCC